MLPAPAERILLVAALAATVSALGPKYRPTPFLTPLTAGVFVAVLATTALYATQRYIAPKPAKPVVASRACGPAEADCCPSGEDRARRRHGGDRAGDARRAGAGLTQCEFRCGHLRARAAASARGKSSAADATPAAVGNSTVPQRGPMEAAAEAIIPSAHAAEPPPDNDHGPGDNRSTMPAAPKKPAAVASIPVPVAAPADRGGFAGNLQVSFDPSGPTARKPGAPLKLAVAAATPVKPAIPPLPRIRPCGADGPACP